MSLSTILNLRRERHGLLDKAGKILTRASKAGRNLTPEEAHRFDRMHQDGDKLLARIQGLENDRAEVNRLENLVPELQPGQVARAAEDAAAEVLALRAWCLGQPDKVRGNARAIRAARRMGLSFGKTEAHLSLSKRPPRTLAEAADRRDSMEQRAMGVATGGAGGYAVPEGFRAEVDVALLAYGGMREVATVLRTAEGNDLPMPTVNDTGNTGELLAENTQAASQDVALGQLILQAYKYSSKIVLVSMELLQDEAVQLESLLGRLLGERIGRILNTQMTVGTGSSQPNGMVTASTLGKTAAAVAAITRNELVDLKHSVDPAYRPGARFMFHDTTLAAVKKLVDSDGRPLWQAGIGEGEPDRIDGDPYVINQDMATLATGAKTVLYGQMSKYLIRDVLDLNLVVFRERYMDYGQLGFLIFSRHDGDLLDAGTHPVKHLIQA